jgi:endonuclease/exonuclease/phosphatase family metal-dependent hydrolase
MQISLLQWNVYYKEDIRNIAKLLLEIKPDIICLQELTNGLQQQIPDADTYQYIAEQLGYTHHSVEIELADADWKFGNGIFTRFPITSQSTAWIQEPGGVDYEDEGRAYIETTLDIDGKHLTIGTTHMSYTHRFEPTDKKAQETDKLLDIIHQKHEQFILTGDFNALPDSPTISAISKLLKNAGPGVKQKTWTTKPFDYNGFVETELKWRLDYIFATPDVNVVSSEILKTDYSDHLPILTRIKVG